MSRYSQKFALLALALALLLPRAARATNVAYVDLQRALLEVSEGRAAKAKLKKEFDKKQQRLDGEQESLRQLKEELDKQSSVMDPAKRAEKESELQRRFMELQQTYMTLQGELSKQEQELTEKIFAKMEIVLREIAEANDLDMIVEKNAGVVFATPALDLTNELIRKFNARFAKPAAGGDKKKPAGK
ncbi:MAG: OmpH family outer membrane protein [Deltaproteobacteria bacterium]|nr:OmpH family outer membrane protein [Deltaproteobacteria bacterium]